MGLYILLELLILAYGLLLSIKPGFWWKKTNKNANQTPPDSYLRNTRIMGILFAVIGTVLLILSLI